MKRRPGFFLLILMLIGLLATPAAAHNLNTTAKLNLKADGLALTVTDVYGAAVEGGKATAAAKGGPKTALAEVAPGIYAGGWPASSTDAYDLIVEITIFSELFRGGLSVRRGEVRTEVPVALVPIDSPLQHSAWGPVLYGLAALVLIAATVVALKRQPREEGEEG